MIRSSTWNSSVNRTQVRDGRDLPGIAVDAVVTAEGAAFRENLLFTHGGISGPSVLQASSY